MCTDQCALQLYFLEVVADYVYIYMSFSKKTAMAGRSGSVSMGYVLPRLARFHRDSRRIFNAAVYAVQPQVLTRKNIHVINDQLNFKVINLLGILC